MEKYQIHKQIGAGAFASVSKATNKANNEIVAIKKMKKKFSTWEECLSLNEIKSLTKLKHSNIIKLIEVIRSNDELFCVFEYAPKTLYSLYLSYKEKGQPLPENMIKSFIYETSQGLAYMHKNGFFHRDMKPENLLLTEDNKIKIADFGLAREIRSRPPFTDYVSTRWYRAPELILKSPNYNSPVDIYALGCIMAELYNQSPLFAGASEIDQLNKICSVLGTPNFNTWGEGIALATKIHYTFPQFLPIDLINLIPSASEPALNLIKEMLSMDPFKRPTALQILQHPYFNEVFISKNLNLDTSSPNKIITKKQKIIVKSNNEANLEPDKILPIEAENKKNNESFDRLREYIKTPEDFIPNTLSPKEIFRSKKEDIQTDRKENEKEGFDPKQLEKDILDIKNVLYSKNITNSQSKTNEISKKFESNDFFQEFSPAKSPQKHEKFEPNSKKDFHLDRTNDFSFKSKEKIGFLAKDDEWNELGVNNNLKFGMLSKDEEIYEKPNKLTLNNSNKPIEFNLFQKKQNQGGSSKLKVFQENNNKESFEYEFESKLKSNLPKLNPIGNLKDFREFNPNFNEKSLDDFGTKSTLIANNAKLPEVSLSKLQSNRMMNQNVANSYLNLKEEKNKTSPLKRNLNLDPLHSSIIQREFN